LLAERGIRSEETVVLYGGSDREWLAELFWLLHWAGCRKVRILDGGFEAWAAAGHPLETRPSQRRAVQFRVPSRSGATVDAAWVAEAFGTVGVELLDVRDVRGWDRWLTPPTFGDGHI